MSSNEVQPPTEGPDSTEPPAQAPTAAPVSNARQPPIAGYRNPIHNPFPASLASECRKAGQIIDSFVNPQYAGLEGAIPRRILAPAKGLIICSVFKAGFLGSVRFGSGLIICRLPDGTWSAPSAISLGGLGGGGQFGMEFTNFVFVLNTDAAVTNFVNSGTLTLGGNISIAFGTGRSAETAAMIGTKGVAGIFAYSKTRGVYGGVTLEGGIIMERSSANKKLYDRKLKAKELLTGEVPPPPQAEPLMRILNSEIFRLPSEGEQSPAAGPPAPASDAPAAETQAASAPGLEGSVPEMPTAEASPAEMPAAEASPTEIPVVEAPIREPQSADAQVQDVRIPEDAVMEPSSQQPEEPAEPGASGAVTETEKKSPQAPSTDKDVQHASQEAAAQPIEHSVADVHDVRKITEENTSDPIPDVQHDLSGTTAEANPASVVDIQPQHPSQPQPDESAATLGGENSKEAKS